MQRFSSKIAFSIVAAGLFIIISFAALDYENITSSFLIVASLLTVFIFLFGFAMGKNHSNPLQELLQEAVRVAKTGKPASNLEISSKDEVEELAKIFQKMANGLSQKSSTIDTLQRSSDIKLKTKDLVSEKVIEVLEAKVENRTAELDQVRRELEQTKMQLTSLQKSKKK